jgi:hypothetical protein
LTGIGEVQDGKGRQALPGFFKKVHPDHALYEHTADQEVTFGEREGMVRQQRRRLMDDAMAIAP